MKVSSGHPVAGPNKTRFSGVGLQCVIEWGISSDATRAAGPGTDLLAERLAQTESLGCALSAKIVESATITQVAVEHAHRGSAGARADDDPEQEPALKVEVGRAANNDERTVVLVEEEHDGETSFSWHFPDEGADHVLLGFGVGANDVDRGLTDVLRRKVRVIALKQVGDRAGNLGESAVRAFEEQRRPHTLRPWRPTDYRRQTDETPDPAVLCGGRSLLVVHGFMGAIHESFGFMPDTIGRLCSAYRGRSLAFDHPTIAHSPHENAQELLAQLDTLRRSAVSEDGRVEIDILAHSRGGLVARELASQCEDAQKKIDIRSIVFVGTPNGGTPLADPERPADLLDAFTSMLTVVPGADQMAMCLELISDLLFRGVAKKLSGAMAMVPDGEYLRRLNARHVPKGVVLRSISTEYQPAITAGFVRSKLDALTDRCFGALRNDRIVPTASTHAQVGEFSIDPGQRLVLDSSYGVHHSNFWKNGRVVDQLTQWLSADEDATLTPQVPEHETDPDVERATVQRTSAVDTIIDAVASAPKALESFFENLNPEAVRAIGTSAERAGAPIVILVPGVMGSHLDVDGTGVWVDPPRLRRGAFAKLAMNGKPSEVTATGLNQTYLGLICHLHRTCDVRLFPYDWRRDLAEPAGALATFVSDVVGGAGGRPIHFVAHSMGGLVVRTLAMNHRELWESLAETDDGGRLITLGTPNLGSYAAVLTLCGQDLAIRGLALADRQHDAQEIVDVVATFPSAYQLLPHKPADETLQSGLLGIADDESAMLYEPSFWEHHLGAPSERVKELLTNASDWQHKLANDEFDTDRCISIAGFGHKTPYRLRTGSSNELEVGQLSEGDGRVAARSATIEGARAIFVDENHGGLVSNSHVLEALPDLIRSGKVSYSDFLLEQPPARRGGGSESIDWYDIDQIDPQPLALGTRGASTRTRNQAQDILDHALAPMLGEVDAAPAACSLTVRIVHGSLEQTSFPVAVGHYSHIPPSGAELYLSSRLDDSLADRHGLDIYPDKPGAAMVVTMPPDRRPGGGAVVCLGPFGELTDETLTAGITDAVLQLSRERAERADLRKRQFGLASVLIGTPGRHGLSVETSMVAVTNGVIRALSRLRSAGVELEPFTLEFIELYQHKADHATTIAESLADHVEPALRDIIDVQVESHLDIREGGRPGAPSPGESGQPWVRVQATLAKDDDDDHQKQTPTADAKPPSLIKDLELLVLGRRAQSDRLHHRMDLDKVRAFVQEAIDATSADQNAHLEDIGRGLFELLLPHDAKFELDRSESLQLILDKEMAQLPWELLVGREALTGRRSSSGRPDALSLRSGMLRKLVDSDSRRRTIKPEGLRALVIGDPPTTLPPLPAARTEAGQISDRFNAKGWEVTERIRATDEAPGAAWWDIDRKLRTKSYRVVHIAAHGVYDEAEPLRSGVVTGPEPHHRLTALDLASMPVAPDLVFLNCCHLGRLDASERGPLQWNDPSYRRPHQLAASLATELMKNGVGAVIVAGWAVADNAAAAFADTLYGRLLDRHPLGEAVKDARRAAHDADGGRSNTWGAYQCYGDPDFQLIAGTARTASEHPINSLNQLVEQVMALSTRIGQISDIADVEHFDRRLESLLQRGRHFVDDPQAALAIGDAYRCLGEYQLAAQWFERSITDPRATTELRAIESWANMAIRAEFARWNADQSSPPRWEEFSEAIEKLDSLTALAGPSVERHMLVARCYRTLARMLKAGAPAPTSADEANPDGSSIIGRLPTTAEEAITLAIERYDQAGAEARKSGGGPHPYSDNIRLQLRWCLEPPTKRPEKKKDALLARQLAEAAAKRNAKPESFWDRSCLGDALLTQALLTQRGDAAKRASLFADARAAYAAAIHHRSTLDERDSVIGYLDELTELFSGHPDGIAEIELLHKELRSEVVVC